MQTKKPFFSIIVPSLNEELYLPNLLEDLSQQSYTNFEVIHVDAQSTDATVKKAESFAKKITITSIISDKKNVSHQRNLGTQKAAGEWIIFMDADNRLPSYFLEGIKYNLSRNADVDIFTTLLDAENCSLANRPIIMLTNVLLELLSHIKPSGPGAMIGIRKKIALEYPFDTTVKLSEDHLLIEQVTQAGHTFACFNDPQYGYSLRRLEKNGTIKTLRTNAKMYLKFFLKMSHDGDATIYPMEGGSLYSKANKKELRMLPKLPVKDIKALPYKLLHKLTSVISE